MSTVISTPMSHEPCPSGYLRSASITNGIEHLEIISITSRTASSAICHRKHHSIASTALPESPSGV